jgi:hypothetical protein
MVVDEYDGKDSIKPRKGREFSSLAIDIARSLSSSEMTSPNSTTTADSPSGLIFGSCVVIG